MPSSSIIKELKRHGFLKELWNEFVTIGSKELIEFLEIHSQCDHQAERPLEIFTFCDFALMSRVDFDKQFPDQIRNKGQSLLLLIEDYEHFRVS